MAAALGPIIDANLLMEFAVGEALGETTYASRRMRLLPTLAWQTPYGKIWLISVNTSEYLFFEL